MVKLFKKLGEKVVVGVLNLLPPSAPKHALIDSIEQKEINKRKILLDNVTILKNNKALLTYKSENKYYTKTIDYRIGAIEPIDYVVIGPYV